jgi:hypothetical protein
MEEMVRPLNGQSTVCRKTNWGFKGVVPVPDDFDGDGIHDMVVYDRATGR